MTSETKEISFGNFKFTPREFNEENLESGLVLSFKISLPKEQHDELFRFYKTNDYFEVTIDNNRTKLMRLGRPFYSNHDEFIKYKIILVSKEYDENVDGELPFHESDPNMSNIIAFNSAYTEELEKLLIRKSILTEEEVQKLRIKSKQSIDDKKFEFGKLDDVDKYSL